MRIFFHIFILLLFSIGGLSACQTPLQPFRPRIKSRRVEVSPIPDKEKTVSSKVVKKESGSISQQKEVVEENLSVSPKMNARQGWPSPVSYRLPPIDESKREKPVATQVFLPHLPSAEYIVGRLHFYQTEIIQWDTINRRLLGLDIEEIKPEGWDVCFNTLQQIVTGYSELEEIAIIQKKKKDRNGLTLKVSQRDISFLESNCRELYARTTELIEKEIDQYKVLIAGQMKEMINLNSVEGHDREIVTLYENLNLNFGEELISSPTQELYGTSLLRLGRLSEAVDVFQKIKQDQPSEKWRLRLLLGELFVAEGKYVDAAEIYKEIVEKYIAWQVLGAEAQSKLDLLASEDGHGGALQLYSIVLKEFLVANFYEVPVKMEQAVNKLKRRYPETDYTELALEMYDEVENTVRTHLAGIINDIKRLGENKKYNLALQTIAGLLKKNVPDSIKEELEVVRADVENLQKEEREKVLQEKADALASLWREADTYFDQEKYDKAIELYSSLLGTTYDLKAKLRIDEAINEAASTLRKEAASIFVKSRKVSSESLKLTLLTQSETLLKTILEKYPSAEIVEKARSNLEVIEKQIKPLQKSFEIMD